ncbi:LysR family transcriptional regulator [Photobacterium swingsii]|uniref:LysR family transcriptional regulator n=1 Tax=Photobacterium swingsii TaxID=680026 RepID=UPI0040683BB6
MNRELPLLETRLLNCFVAIAETGNLRKAGLRLGKAKSTVSRWLSELEDLLGYPLFERESSGLVLTLNERGEGLLTKARTVLATLGRFEDFAFAKNNHLAPSKLTFCFNQLVANECITELMLSLRSLVPETEITIVQCVGEEMQNHLVSGDVDFVLDLAPENLFPDIGGMIVGEEQVMVLAHPTHPLSCQDQIESQQLISQTIIIPQFLDIRKDNAYFHPIESIVTPDFQLAIDLAKANLGIAYTPEHIARHTLISGELKQLSLNWEEFSQQLPLMLFYRLNFPYPSLKQHLIDTIRDWYGFQ